ncbi:MAG: AIR synthase-related protein, partial [Gemmobacter sp.]
GAGADLHLDWAAVPLLEGVTALAEAGHITGASGRNWASYGDEIALPPGFAPVARALLTDPQTSGGLLVSCAPDAADAVLATFARHGFADAAVIGRVGDRSPAPRLRLG